jgi:Tol biopolymer transport system component
MMVSIEGGEVKPLLPESKTSNLMPQISPDGNSLAYLAIEYDSKTSDFNMSVRIVPVKNGAVVGEQVSEMKFNLHNKYKWSPAGKSLTFITKKENHNIWNINIKDKKEKQLTEFKSGDLIDFTWSKDGKKLLVVRGITNSDLVLIKDAEAAS